MKNYIGIQDDRHRLIDHDHRLNEKVADLQYIIQPQFIAIDAITAGEGRMPVVQGLAEAVAFGDRAGLDMKQVLDVIGKGAAQSWQMDNRGKTMVADKFDFGFAVDWMRKDLGLVLDEAKRNGARLPVTALVDQFYAQVIARGGRRWDTSSLINLLAND